VNRVLVGLLTILVVMAVLGCRPATKAPNPAMNPGGGPPTQSKTPSGPPVEVSIYAPCGLAIPLREAFAAFEASHPGTTTKPSFDNASIQTKKIKKGDQPDLYVSPGGFEATQLEQAGLVDPNVRFVIGEFQLVCIVPTGNPKGIKTPQDLTKATLISMPDPEVNSVGYFGRQALTKLGLWDQLAGVDKFMFKEHVIEAHSLVAQGKTDAGIAFKNCPLETNPEKLSKAKVEVAFEFPADSYEKPYCVIAGVKGGPHPQQAAELGRWLTTPEAQSVLAKNGLTSVEPGTQAPAAAQGPAAETSGLQSDPNALVVIEAWYPDNEGHAYIKQYLADLKKKHGAKVDTHFIDWQNSPNGWEWQEFKKRGLSCGTIVINGENEWTYLKDGKPTEAVFRMGEGGMYGWTKEALFSVVDELIKKGPQAKKKP